MLLICLAGVGTVLSFMNRPESLTVGMNHVEMSIGHIGNPFCFYVTSITLSITLIWACKMVLKLIGHNYISFLGRNTLVILTVHYFYISIIGAFLGNINNKLGINDQIVSLIEFVVVMLLMIPSISVLSIYLPNIVGKTVKV